jgi:SP family sugar:H+ symporter-like MFS transporter
MAMPFFIHQFAGLPYPPSNLTKAQADSFNIPAWRQSLIVSILSAGTFFGALIAGDLADFIGRRLTIIAGCAVFTLGVILQASRVLRPEKSIERAIPERSPPAEILRSLFDIHLTS